MRHVNYYLVAKEENLASAQSHHALPEERNGSFTLPVATAFLSSTASCSSSGTFLYSPPRSFDVAIIVLG